MALGCFGMWGVISEGFRAHTPSGANVSAALTRPLERPHDRISAKAADRLALLLPLGGSQAWLTDLFCRHLYFLRLHSVACCATLPSFQCWLVLVSFWP